IRRGGPGRQRGPLRRRRGSWGRRGGADQREAPQSAQCSPAWAVAYVASTDRRKAATVAPVAFDLGDSVGLLKPIEIRRRCLACHATLERIAPDTRDWLRRAYPQDRSFGYALGDLRGFWWAEAA